MHEELRCLVAAYALRALPPEDVSIVRGHLLSCFECRAEARDHCGVLDRLAHSIQPAPAPEGLSERVLAAISGEAGRCEA